uniref:Putative methyl transferase n=1 Tax=Streptomyces argenteolus TaxID=67274 RepID=A9ZNW0_9ACTN|nr:putative methyl transferase [Streptomyces argenteolus]
MHRQRCVLRYHPSSGGGPMTTGRKLKLDLGDVQETMLWTLYHRATEARDPETVLHDPWAVQLVETIEYPFEKRFGTPTAGQAQWQALRARCFDEEIRRFLARHPDGTVVALGEGLETQFSRVDNGRVHWLSVDLPEVIEVRRRLRPDDAPRQRSLACSVLDDRWMTGLDGSRGLLVTARGLLMYLRPTQVHGLIAACAERLPGGALLFDAVPSWLSRRSTLTPRRTPTGYRFPPWLWGVDAGETARLQALHPNIVDIREIRPPRGRGPVYRFLVPLIGTVPGVRGRKVMSIMIVRFGPSGAPAPSRAIPPDPPDLPRR